MEIEKNELLSKLYTCAFAEPKTSIQVTLDLGVKIDGQESYYLKLLEKHPSYFERKSKQPDGTTELQKRLFFETTQEQPELINKTYRSKIKPLIQLIHRIVPLSDDEKRILAQFLDTKSFRKLIRYKQGFEYHQDILGILQKYSYEILMKRALRLPMAIMAPMYENFIDDIEKAKEIVFQGDENTHGPVTRDLSLFYRYNQFYRGKVDDFRKDLMGLESTLIQKLIDLPKIRTQNYDYLVGLGYAIKYS